jgi:hypothetical protein
MGQLTNTRRSDGVPDPDGDLKTVVRIEIRHYRNLYFIVLFFTGDGHDRIFSAKKRKWSWAFTVQKVSQVSVKMV